MVQSARWTMTINIVSSITALSVDNSAAIWILPGQDNLDFTVIKVVDPTYKLK